MLEQGTTKSYEDLRNLSAEDVYTALFAHVNGPSMRFQKAFEDRFRREHPTLQQAFVRHVIRPVLEILATELYGDARNEASIRFAKAAVEATKSEHLPTV